MPILQYETRISPEGYITLPPLPEYRDRNVIVYVGENRNEAFDNSEQPDPVRILPNGKTAIDDFLDYYRVQPPTSLTDEEIDQLRYEAMKEKYGL